MIYHYKNFDICPIYTGEKEAPWGNNWNHHIVTITNTNNSRKTCFDFWGSQVNPQIENKREAIEAFECFIEDALAGKMTFDEFCGEFGYSEDSKKAEKTWNDCRKATKKLSNVYDGDWYKLANDINKRGL